MPKNHINVKLKREIEQRRQAEDALLSILDETSKVSGNAYFHALTQRLAEALRVSTVIAGKISEQDNKQVCESISVFHEGEYQDTLTFDISTSPSCHIVDEKVSTYPFGVQLEFPDARFLADFYADGYISTSMVSTEGKLLGMLCILDNKPLSERTRHYALNLLSVFAMRGAADLEHESVEKELAQRIAHRTLALKNSNEHLKQTLHKLNHAHQHLIESERLSSLGNLVASVSNEINDPLSIMHTASTVLHDRAEVLFEKFESGALKRSDLEKFKADFTESNDMVTSNLKRCLSLMKSFKNIAVDTHIQDGPVHIMVHELLEDTVSSIQPKFKAANHAIHIHCNPNIELCSYPGSLSQTLLHLLFNSFSHSFMHGQIGDIEIKVTQTESGINLEYQDNGKGLTTEAIKHLFDPFSEHNVNAQDSDAFAMYIVKGIIDEKLQGSIDCQSIPNRGIYYHVQLPNLYESPSHHAQPNLVQD